MEMELEKMIVVEEDGDLAGFVAGFFRNRFEVSRAETLLEASNAIRELDAGVLLADIDPRSAEEISLVQRIRRERPKLRIILTYLTPSSGEVWEKRAGMAADILIRKPYGLAAVDKIIRSWDGKSRDQA
jgi:DNA-binding response OmpR family regulator